MSEEFNTGTGHGAGTRSRLAGFRRTVIAGLAKCKGNERVVVFEFSANPGTICKELEDPRIHYHTVNPEEFCYNTSPDVSGTSAISLSTCVCGFAQPDKTCKMCNLHDDVLSIYRHVFFFTLDVAYKLTPYDWLRLMKNNQGIRNRFDLANKTKTTLYYFAVLQMVSVNAIVKGADCEQYTVGSQVYVSADNDYVNWEDDASNTEFLWKGGLAINNMWLAADKLKSVGDFVSFQLHLRTQRGVPYGPVNQTKSGVEIEKQGLSHLLYIRGTTLLSDPINGVSGMKKTVTLVILTEESYQEMSNRLTFNATPATLFNRARYTISGVPASVAAGVLAYIYFNQIASYGQVTDSLILGRIPSVWNTVSDIPTMILSQILMDLYGVSLHANILGTKIIEIAKTVFKGLQLTLSAFLMLGAVAVAAATMPMIIEPAAIMTLLYEMISYAQGEFKFKYFDNIRDLRIQQKCGSMPFDSIPRLFHVNCPNITRFVFNDSKDDRMFQLPSIITPFHYEKHCMSCGVSGCLTYECATCHIATHLGCQHHCLPHYIPSKISQFHPFTDHQYQTPQPIYTGLPLACGVIIEPSHETKDAYMDALEEGLLMIMNGKIIALPHDESLNTDFVWQLTNQAILRYRLIDFKGAGCEFLEDNKTELVIQNLATARLSIGWCPHHAYGVGDFTRNNYNSYSCSRCSTLLSNAVEFFSFKSTSMFPEGSPYIIERLQEAKGAGNFMVSHGERNIFVMNPTISDDSIEECDHDDEIYVRIRIQDCYSNSGVSFFDQVSNTFDRMTQGSTDDLNRIDRLRDTFTETFRNKVLTGRPVGFGFVHLDGKHNPKWIMDNRETLIIVIQGINNQLFKGRILAIRTRCSIMNYGPGVNFSKHRPVQNFKHFNDMCQLVNNRPQDVTIVPFDYDVADVTDLYGDYNQFAKKARYGPMLRHSLDTWHYVLITRNFNAVTTSSRHVLNFPKFEVDRSRRTMRAIIKKNDVHWRRLFNDENSLIIENIEEDEVTTTIDENSDEQKTIEEKGQVSEDDGNSQTVWEQPVSIITKNREFDTQKYFRKIEKNDVDTELTDYLKESISDFEKENATRGIKPVRLPIEKMDQICSLNELDLIRPKNVRIGHFDFTIIDPPGDGACGYYSIGALARIEPFILKKRALEVAGRMFSCIDHHLKRSTWIDHAIIDIISCLLKRPIVTVLIVSGAFHNFMPVNLDFGTPPIFLINYDQGHFSAITHMSGQFIRYNATYFANCKALSPFLNEALKIEDNMMDTRDFPLENSEENEDKTNEGDENQERDHAIGNDREQQQTQHEKEKIVSVQQMKSDDHTTNKANDSDLIIDENRIVYVPCASSPEVGNIWAMFYPNDDEIFDKIPGPTGLLGFDWPVLGSSSQRPFYLMFVKEKRDKFITLTHCPLNHGDSFEFGLEMLKAGLTGLPFGFSGGIGKNGFVKPVGFSYAKSVACKNIGIDFLANSSHSTNRQISLKVERTIKFLKELSDDGNGEQDENIDKLNSQIETSDESTIGVKTKELAETETTLHSEQEISQTIEAPKPVDPINSQEAVKRTKTIIIDEDDDPEELDAFFGNDDEWEDYEDEAIEEDEEYEDEFEESDGEIEDDVGSNNTNNNDSVFELKQEVPQDVSYIKPQAVVEEIRKPNIEIKPLVKQQTITEPIKRTISVVLRQDGHPIDELLVSMFCNAFYTKNLTFGKNDFPLESFNLRPHRTSAFKFQPITIDSNFDKTIILDLEKVSYEIQLISDKFCELIIENDGVRNNIWLQKDKISTFKVAHNEHFIVTSSDEWQISEIDYIAIKDTRFSLKPQKKTYIKPTKICQENVRIDPHDLTLCGINYERIYKTKDALIQNVCRLNPIDTIPNEKLDDVLFCYRLAEIANMNFCHVNAGPESRQCVIRKRKTYYPNTIIVGNGFFSVTDSYPSIDNDSRENEKNFCDEVFQKYTSLPVTVPALTIEQIKQNLTEELVVILRSYNSGSDYFSTDRYFHVGRHTYNVKIMKPCFKYYGTQIDLGSFDDLKCDPLNDEALYRTANTIRDKILPSVNRAFSRVTMHTHAGFELDETFVVTDYCNIKGSRNFNFARSFLDPWKFSLFRSLSLAYFSCFPTIINLRTLLGPAGAGKSRLIGGWLDDREIGKCYSMLSMGSLAAKKCGGATYESGLIKARLPYALDESFIASLQYHTLIDHINRTNFGSEWLMTLGDPAQCIGGGNFSHQYSWLTPEWFLTNAQKFKCFNKIYRFGGAEGQAIANYIYKHPDCLWRKMGLPDVEVVGRTNLRLNVGVNHVTSVRMHHRSEDVAADRTGLGQTTRAMQGVDYDVTTYLEKKPDFERGFTTVGLTRSRDTLYVTREMMAKIKPTESVPSFGIGSDVLVGYTPYPIDVKLTEDETNIIDLSKVSYSNDDSVDKYKRILATTCASVHRSSRDVNFYEMTANVNVKNGGSQAAAASLQMLVAFYGIATSKYQTDAFDINETFANVVKTQSNQSSRLNFFFLDANTLSDNNKTPSLNVTFDLLAKLHSDIQKLNPKMKMILVYKMNCNRGFGKQICFPWPSMAWDHETYWLFDPNCENDTIGFPRHDSGRLLMFQPQLALANSFKLDDETKHIEAWEIKIKKNEDKKSIILHLKTSQFTNLPNNPQLIKKIVNSKQRICADMVEGSTFRFKFLYTYHIHSNGNLDVSEDDVRLFSCNSYYRSGYHIISGAGVQCNAKSYVFSKDGKLNSMEQAFNSTEALEPFTVPDHLQMCSFEHHPPETIKVRLSAPISAINPFLIGKRSLHRVKRDYEADFQANNNPEWALPEAKLPGIEFSSTANTDCTKTLGFVNRLLKDPTDHHPIINWVYIHVLLKLHLELDTKGINVKPNYYSRTNKEFWIKKKMSGRQKVLWKNADFIASGNLNKTENFGKVEKQVTFISTNPRMIASMNPSTLVLTGPAVDGWQTSSLEHQMIIDSPLCQTDGMSGEDIATRIQNCSMNLGGDGESYDGGMSIAMTFLQALIVMSWMMYNLEKEVARRWTYKALVGSFSMIFFAKMLSGCAWTLKLNSKTTELLQILALRFLTDNIKDFMSILCSDFRCNSNGDDALNNGLTLQRNGIKYVDIWPFFTQFTGVRYVPEVCPGMRVNYNSATPMMDNNGDWYMQKLDIERALKALFVKTTRSNTNQRPENILSSFGDKVLLKRDAQVQIHSERFGGEAMPIVRAFIDYISDRIGLDKTRKFREKMKKKKIAEQFQLTNTTRHVPDDDYLQEYIIDRYGHNLKSLHHTESLIRTGKFDKLMQDELWISILETTEHADKHKINSCIFGLLGTELSQENIIYTNEKRAGNDGLERFWLSANKMITIKHV